MKTKCLFFLLVIFSTVNPAFAQEFEEEMETAREPKSVEERANNMTERLNKELSFSAEQKAQVYDINLAAAKQMDDLRAKNKTGQGDKKAKFQEMRKINQERDSKIESLLTETQKVKYQEMKAKAKQKKMDKMRERRNSKN